MNVLIFRKLISKKIRQCIPLKIKKAIERRVDILCDNIKFKLTQKRENNYPADKIDVEGNAILKKYPINSEWKNAFLLNNAKEGYMAFKYNGSDKLYYYIGLERKIRYDNKRFLKVWMIFNDKKRLILEKKLNALELGWNCFFCHVGKIGADIGDVVKIEWKVTPAWPRENVFFSAPYLVSNKSDSKKIIVIVLDGIIQDVIGLYGSKLGITENIDDFFAEGCWFFNSYAQAEWTLPAFASIVTSHYSSVHKVVDPNLYTKSLPAEHVVLSEILQKNNFLTYENFAHIRCSPELGYHRGCDNFIYRKVNNEVGDNYRKSISSLIDFLEVYNKQDVFAIAHIFDTHHNFYKLPQFPLDEESALRRESMEAFRKFDRKLPAELKRYVMDFYRLKLKEVDRYLNFLFQYLKRMDNTSIILTSDHGFRTDFGVIKEEEGLSDAQIKTPFLFYSNCFNVKKGGNSKRFIESSIDIFPTVLDIAGIKERYDVSGLKIFDTKHSRIVDKDYSISESNFKDIFELKIYLRPTYEMKIKSFRFRDRFEADLTNANIEFFDNKIKIKKADIPNSLKKRFLDIVLNSGVEHDLKDKLKILLTGIKPT